MQKLRAGVSGWISGWMFSHFRPRPLLRCAVELWHHRLPGKVFVFWIDYAKKQFLLKSNPKFFHDQNTFCLYTYMINFIFSVEIEIIPSRRWLLSIFKINHFSINWPQVRQAGLHPSVLPGADGGDLWKRGKTSSNQVHLFFLCLSILSKTGNATRQKNEGSNLIRGNSNLHKILMRM